MSKTIGLFPAWSKVVASDFKLAARPHFTLFSIRDQSADGLVVVATVPRLTVAVPGSQIFSFIECFNSMNSNKL